MLHKIQNELKAPKNQFNSFGNYKYRSLEDIMEAVKPALEKYGCYLIMSYTPEIIGERYYIKAEATIYEGEKIIARNTAYARESEDKKGMDSAQITGATISYAGKYALGGLFCIDDTKDPDTNEYASKTGNATPQRPTASKATQPAVTNSGICQCGAPIKGNYKLCYTCNQSKRTESYGNDPMDNFQV